MNFGFEYCTVLNELLESNDNDFKTVFKLFEQKRKPNTDAIAELAVENFIEMRDKVADPKFLLRKKIEAKINQLYPEKWIPQYSMITFSHIPYSKALEEGQKQQTIMDKVMAINDIEEKWDSEEVLNIINELISEAELA
jgi:kynurenine 3-monooxygenase